MNNLLTINMITREAVKLFANENLFLQQYAYDKAFRTLVPVALPSVSLPVAAVMGVAAVVIKNPVLSRRSLFGGG